MIDNHYLAYVGVILLFLAGVVTVTAAALAGLAIAAAVAGIKRIITKAKAATASNTTHPQTNTDPPGNRANKPLS